MAKKRGISMNIKDKSYLNSIYGYVAQNLANELKKARKMAGLTQKELAQHLGIKQGRLSEYENGKRFPSHRNWEKIYNFIVKWNEV